MKFILILFLSLYFNLSYSDSLKVLFLGDTYFGDNYQMNNGNTAINEYGYDYFFENVKDILYSSDFTIANLETPLYRGKIKPPSGGEKYTHFADKDSTPFYLNKYNIHTVSLSNNHTFDLGKEGLSSIFSGLSYYNIHYFGAGFSEEAASLPFIYAKSGVIPYIVIFTGYWYCSRFDSVKHYYAKGDKEGVFLLDPVKISEKIKEYRGIFPNAYFVVYPHWGSNYKIQNQYQTDIAHKLIDAGVDLIIGHGAHTVQEVEHYKGKWILYNIGNFIFNSPGRYGSTGAKPYGLMAELNISRDSRSLKLYPVFTNNLETDYQARRLEEGEFDDCFNFVFKSNKDKIHRSGKEYFIIKLD